MWGSVHTRVHTIREDFICFVEVVGKEKNVDIHGGSKNAHNPHGKSPNQPILKTLLLERRDYFFKNKLEIHEGDPFSDGCSLIAIVPRCYYGNQMEYKLLLIQINIKAIE
ncbi:MAG: hypothetical protein HGA69_00795 [Desulfobulbaceae bacterium]|nr:hypothetical protein [Desulfobulbaceae bacterium]